MLIDFTHWVIFKPANPEISAVHLKSGSIPDESSSATAWQHSVLSGQNHNQQHGILDKVTGLVTDHEMRFSPFDSNAQHV